MASKVVVKRGRPFKQPAAAVREIVKAGLADSKAYAAVAAIIAQQAWGSGTIEPATLGKAVYAASKERSVRVRGGFSEDNAAQAGLAAAYGVALGRKPQSKG